MNTYKAYKLRLYPNDIQTELNKYNNYNNGTPPAFYEMKIEGLYEDNGYKIRIPSTYEAVDKDMDVYIGTVEVTVIHNESDYDIFVYSQQPIAKVELSSTVLSEVDAGTNRLIKKYNVTKSPNRKILKVTLQNENSINFTINL